MTDAQRVDGGEGLAPLPGLQLLGEDTAMGACVDGVCAVPGASPASVGAEKAD
ncbi:hypothetical protein [Microbacterium esteraromaticum]|uniref:hypothetical protein n=1 Tax=Microbacterium esteraromaticum TaxID=57043 RepID=UPI001C951AA1|nr:hypothetical protein [Microbacterium esteraromaticum]MBY6060583.1 hypothetical protein [Microbacterium esteraromaticum]MCA1305785.1 hypothetical protein [Microbacterium esteraromaticum]